MRPKDCPCGTFAPDRSARRPRTVEDMTSTTDQQVTHALRRAVERAVLAPSVHNTQPWTFTLNHATLTLRADRSRQLRVLDASARQLMISCGCALFNMRVSLAADGLDALVTRLPKGPDSDVVATLEVTHPSSTPAEVDRLAALDSVVELRQTNRRRFSDEPVPEEVVDSLVAACETEQTHLVEVRTAEHRLAVAVLSQRADSMQYSNPAYRAELRNWTSDDPKRRDGVPALAVPHVDEGSGDEVPIRDFDTRGMGWLPTATHSSKDQCLLLLGSDGDDVLSWLRAGEALERVLLEVTRQGYVSSPLTQVVEVPSTRAALQRELMLTMHPHVLLRVGRAPVTPSTRRRPLSDMLVDPS